MAARCHSNRDGIVKFMTDPLRVCAATPLTGNIAMSESERLIRARIARLTELLAQLDESSRLMGDHYASYANSRPADSAAC